MFPDDSSNGFSLLYCVFVFFIIYPSSSYGFVGRKKPEGSGRCSKFRFFLELSRWSYNVHRLYLILIKILVVTREK